MPLLLIAFIVVPLVELFVIGQVADWVGIGPTIVILFLDSLAGAVLVRREGSRAWASFRAALRQRRWPGDEVVQGALVLVGGSLLVTPGFVTDVVGLLLVLPPTRATASRLIRLRLTPAPLTAFMSATSSDPSAPGSGHGPDAGSDPGSDPGPGATADEAHTGEGADVGDELDVEVVSIEREDRPRRGELSDGPDDAHG